MRPSGVRVTLLRRRATQYRQTWAAPLCERDARSPLCPSQASLRKYFEQYGTVERAAVKHPNARPWQRHEPENHTAQRSFGFITVFSDELAKKLMSMTHIIDGHHVGTPELAKPARNDREKVRRGEGPEGALNANAIHVSAGWALGPTGSWEPAATRKIFVGGLSHQTKDQSLFSYFSQFGTVADVVVMTEGSSRRPRGFGFVTFEDPKVVMAVTRTRYHPIEGRLVEVKPAVPREIMSLTQGQNPAVVGAGDNDFATPTGDAMACGPFVPDSTPCSPTMASQGQEWYPNGYGYGYQQNYAAPNQIMIGGGMPDMTMTTGVPVYNGYAPGFAPQMMVPMGMMMPMANVMGTAMPPVMSPAMSPSMVPSSVVTKRPQVALPTTALNQMAALPQMMPTPHNMMHGGASMIRGSNMAYGALVPTPQMHAASRIPPSSGGQPAGGCMSFIASAPMAIAPMSTVPMGHMPNIGHMPSMVMPLGTMPTMPPHATWSSAGSAAPSSYAGPLPMPGAVPVDATAALKTPEAQTESATKDSSA